MNLCIIDIPGFPESWSQWPPWSSSWQWPGCPCWPRGRPPSRSSPPAPDTGCGPGAQTWCRAPWPGCCRCPPRRSCCPRPGRGCRAGWSCAPRTRGCRNSAEESCVWSPRKTSDNLGWRGQKWTPWEEDTCIKVQETLWLSLYLQTICSNTDRCESDLIWTIVKIWRFCISIIVLRVNDTHPWCPPRCWSPCPWWPRRRWGPRRCPACSHGSRRSAPRRQSRGYRWPSPGWRGTRWEMCCWSEKC